MPPNNSASKDSPLKSSVITSGIVSLIVLIVGQLIIYNFISPPIKPNVTVEYEYLDNLPSNYTPPTSFDVLLDEQNLSIHDEQNKPIRLEWNKVLFTEYIFYINSDGETNDNNFRIILKSTNRKMITSYKFGKAAYGYFKVSEDEKNSDKEFHLHLHPLPTSFNMTVNVKFPIFTKNNNNIKNNDFEWCFISDTAEYEAVIREKVELSSSTESDMLLDIDFGGTIKPKFFGVVYAGETTKNKEKGISGGFWISGYDPLILAHEIFNHLDKEGVYTNAETNEIDQMMKNYESPFHGISGTGISFSGLSFGGFSFIKFYNITFRALIRSKKISEIEAYKIIKKSKNSGGVLINGYNFIVMDVEILNALLLNKEIKREVGQSIIDRAKKDVIFKDTDDVKFKDTPDTKFDGKNIENPK